MRTIVGIFIFISIVSSCSAELSLKKIVNRRIRQLLKLPFSPSQVQSTPCGVGPVLKREYCIEKQTLSYKSCVPYKGQFYFLFSGGDGKNQNI